MLIYKYIFLKISLSTHAENAADEMGFQLLIPHEYFGEP